MRPADRRALLTWAAIVVPLWLVLALCCHWEPVVRDGWGHVRWHRWTGLSPGALWQSIEGGYLHNNPRLGQIVTTLLYTPGPWHTVLEPLLELAMFGLLTTLVLGRRPSLRSTEDALVFATVTAMVMTCVPIVGQILFYRPYSGNYLFGFAMQLAFLVPYRVRGEGEASDLRRRARVVAGARDVRARRRGRHVQRAHAAGGRRGGAGRGDRVRSAQRLRREAACSRG